MNHDEITATMSLNGYGKGVIPNPFAGQQSEWQRRRKNARALKMITDKIESLFEPRFITPPETSECIESIITMTDSRRILEIGMHTGFGTLHMLRAIYGKPGAKMVSVESRPTHDKEFFDQLGIFRQIVGWTPDALLELVGETFDLVFVDSDHSIEHTQKELHVLWSITHSGTIFLFHDLPAWHTPDNKNPVPVRTWLLNHPDLVGAALPSCEQLDCLDVWGHGYPKQCNPGLGIFVRK